MPKEYSISDILALPPQHIQYYAGTFEETEDPEIEWPHRHSFFSLVWFTEGSGFYVIDLEEYEIKPNRIFLVSPKQVHNWDYSGNSKGYLITVDHSFGKELDICCQSPYLDIDNEAGKRLEIVFLDLIDNFQNQNNTTIDILYIYKQIERTAAQNQLKPYTTNLQFINFKTLITENHSNILTIEQYADRCNLSINELNTLCKEYAGISAKQYILDLKITEAKRLLIYSKNNISEVAFLLGFEDSSYFSRIFKKKTHLPPSDFLKKYRKQE